MYRVSKPRWAFWQRLALVTIVVGLLGSVLLPPMPANAATTVTCDDGSSSGTNGYKPGSSCENYIQNYDCIHDDKPKGKQDTLTCNGNVPPGDPGGPGGPLDSDNDGVRDENDACPHQGNEFGPVDSRGCPPDRDQDGYPDPIDDCPNDGNYGYGLYATGCPLVGFTEHNKDIGSPGLRAYEQLRSNGHSPTVDQDWLPWHILYEYGIVRWSSTQMCIVPDPEKGQQERYCTSLNGIQLDAIRGLIDLVYEGKELGFYNLSHIRPGQGILDPDDQETVYGFNDIIITGGTEYGHSPEGTYNHPNGYAIDLSSANPAFNNYMGYLIDSNNGLYQTCTGFTYPMYVSNDNTILIYDERERPGAPHWHITFRTPARGTSVCDFQ